ncbi:MAG: hypothetical protein AABZ60_21675 [Planctomycetota bacterium]
MSDIIQFQCESCGRGIRAKITRAGASVKCPGCAKPVTVPRVGISVSGKAKKENAGNEENLIRPEELLKMKQKRPGSLPPSSPPPLGLDDTEVSFEKGTQIHVKPLSKKSIELPSTQDSTYIGGLDPSTKLKKNPLKQSPSLKKNAPDAAKKGSEKEEKKVILEEPETKIAISTSLKAPDTYTGPESPQKKDEPSPATDMMEDTYTGLIPKKLKAPLDTYMGNEREKPETQFEEDLETTSEFEENPETTIDMEETFTGLTPKKLSSSKKDRLTSASLPPTKLSEVPTSNLPLEEKIDLRISAEQKVAKKPPTARTIKIADIPEKYPKPSTNRNPVYSARGEMLTFTDFVMAYVPIFGVFYGVYLLVVQRFAQRGRFILVRSLTITTISLILFLVPLLWYLRGLNSLYQCQNNLRALGCGISQYSAMFGNYEYPKMSGSAFFTSLQKYQLLSDHRYFFCPGTSAYAYASENQTVAPKEIGYLGRRNAEEAFRIPKIPENEAEILIGADKTHPSDVHGSQVNVLFLDSHIKTYPAFHEELGGRRSPFGGILEVLAD